MRGVVLIAIDIAAQLILLAIDLRFFFVRQISAVLPAVMTNLVVQPGFFVLKIGCLMRCQRTIRHPIRNPILLILLALLNFLRLQYCARHHNPGYSKC